MRTTSTRASLAILAIAVAILLIAVAVPAAWRVAPARAALRPSEVTLTLKPVHTGFDDPVAVTSAGDGSGRLFVVEQGGTVRLVANHTVQAAPYIDLRSRVSTGGERGLLSIAFHPGFETNGRIFAAYTDADGDLRVVRLTTSPASATVDTGTELLILEIPHPTHANHNGGQLAFGPDGYLYVGTGDGGGAGDPDGNAQNRTRALGKILRIDVNHTCCGRQYVIPWANPYRTGTAFRPEILHYGVRNPWRFSFDRQYGNLWVADVGQSLREEVNLLARGAKAANLGWDCREANADVSATYGAGYCAGRSFTAPLSAYQTHAGGRCSAIGGHVYRGKAYASTILGMYVYGDFCSGELFGITHVGNNRYVSGAVGRREGAKLTDFGEGDTGELYAVGLEGNLYRVTAARR